MFAVVALKTKPRKHCVIPEKYIFGLDKMEDQLKTWGANKAHDHLIFWSRELINDDISPNSMFHPPNFNVDRCEEFPPPLNIDNACYLGRVKCFFSE